MNSPIRQLSFFGCCPPSSLGIHDVSSGVPRAGENERRELWAEHFTPARQNIVAAIRSSLRLTFRVGFLALLENLFKIRSFAFA